MPTVVGLVLLAAVLAATAGWIIGARRVGSQQASRSGKPTEATASPLGGTGGDDATTTLVDPERKAMIDGIISVRDLLDNPALSARLGSILNDVGVITLDPTGEIFDPAKHQAQAPPTLVSDPTLEGTIAEVISYGYSERGAITRFPVVIINRYSEHAT